MKHLHLAPHWWTLLLAGCLLAILPTLLTGAENIGARPPRPPRPQADIVPVTAAAGPGLSTQQLSGTLTASDLVNSLLSTDAGVIVSNITRKGAEGALGTFAGGADIIGFEQGIVLSSGDVANIIGPNVSSEASESNDLAGDSDLDLLVNGNTRDAAVLEFDFVPTGNKVAFQYVFGSEEYNYYVNSPYNDVFAFFVNGVNYAVLPNNDVVSINNINLGKNSDYYRDNDFGSSSLINTQMNGLTTVLGFMAPVNPGVTNHIKLVIADRGDTNLDSHVLIMAGSLTAQQADLSLQKVANTPTPKIGGKVTYTLTLTNGGPKEATNLEVADALPAGLTLLSQSGDGNYAATAGVWSIAAVAAGASKSVSLVCRVNTDQPVTNTAELTVSPLPDPDSTPNNHVATEDDQASVQVTPIPNHAPVATNAAMTAVEGTLTPGVLPATDPDNDPLVYAIVTQPAHGTVTLTDPATGAFAYISDLGYTGADSFTFKANDDIVDSNIATISITVTPVYRQPDLLIRLPDETVEAGDDVYNATGYLQTKAVDVDNAQTADYIVRVQNDGNIQDKFVVKGPAGNSGWTIAYVDLATGDSLTAAITGTNGWTTPYIGPGNSLFVQVSVTPSLTLQGGAAKSVLLTVTPLNNALKKDAVRMNTALVIRRLPDLKIRNAADSDYVGNNIYNATAVDQTKSQMTDNTVPVAYLLHVENDGNVPDTFRVTGPAAVDGWTVQYVEMSTGADLTAQITGDGWVLANLAPRGFKGMTLRVNPGAYVTGNASLTRLLTVISEGEPDKTDAAQAITSVRIRHVVDGLVKRLADAAYLGDNLYNTTAQGQTLAVDVDYDAPLDYLVAVQNDGNMTEQCTVTAPAAPAGWTVKYYNQANGQDITTSVLGAGWTVPSCTPLSVTLIRVRVTAPRGLAPFSVCPLAVNANAKLTGVQDTVKTVTALKPCYLPDLWIRAADEAGFTGKDVYSAAAQGQVASQVLLEGGTVVYPLVAQNDGALADILVVKGPAGSAGWTVRYLDDAMADITAQVTGAGWSTPLLAPGAFAKLRIVITAGGSVAPGAGITQLVTAVSHNTTLAVDAVKAITATANSLADTPSAMFHRNLEHTGRTALCGPAGNWLRWTYPTLGSVHSSPTLGADGTVYIGSEDKRLYALKPDGTLRWAYLTGGPVESTPAVSGNGVVYVGSTDGSLYALNPNGTLAWCCATGGAIYSSPAIGKDGTVYVGSNDGYLYAVLQTGVLKWRYALGEAATDDPAYSSPAVGPDGIIYIGALAGSLHAVKPNGTKKWAYAAGGTIQSSPTVAPDGVVYVGCNDGKLYAISDAGVKKWAYGTGNKVVSSPALGADGTIYVGSNSQKFYAVLPTGQKKWDKAFGNQVCSSPAVGGDGTVYVGTHEGYLYAIRSNGVVRWSLQTQNWIFSSPAIGADGTVYVGSDDGSVYAVGPGIGTPACQPDLQVLAPCDTAYIGNNIYNTTGDKQTGAQTAPLGLAVSFRLRVQNDANIDDRVFLTAPAADAAWTVRYYNAANQDITAQVTGDGWTGDLLAPGQYQEISVQLQPALTAGSGAQLTTLITAASQTDAAKKDAIKLVVTAAQ